MIQIAVGDVGLVGLRIDGDLRDAAEVVRIVAAGGVRRTALLVLAAHAHFRLAVLRDELALTGELHDVRVARAVAADPDVARVIDEDAVIRRGPVEALAGSAPATDDGTGLVEDDHRRRRLAALGDLELEAAFVVVEIGRTAVDEPHVVLRVDVHADRHAEQPVIRQRLRPERIDLEPRRLGLALRLDGRLPREDALRDEQCAYQGQECVYLSGLSVSYRLRGPAEAPDPTGPVSGVSHSAAGRRPGTRPCNCRR